MKTDDQRRPRRIILAIHSRLLKSMLQRAIARIPTLQVVGEVVVPSELSQMIEQTDAEWVVVSLTTEGQIPAIAGPLLSKHPSLRILAVANDGSQVKMKWVEPREEILDDLSLDDLITTLSDSRSERQQVQ